jgi:hypothetical protein
VSADGTGRLQPSLPIATESLVPRAMATVDEPDTPTVGSDAGGPHARAFRQTTAARPSGLKLAAVLKSLRIRFQSSALAPPLFLSRSISSIVALGVNYAAVRFSVDTDSRSDLRFRSKKWRCPIMRPRSLSSENSRCLCYANLQITPESKARSAPSCSPF